MTEALEKEFAVVAGYVMFAGDTEHFFLPEAFEDLAECVEFAGFRKVGQVAGVENQIGLVDGGIDLVDGQLQGTVDVRISGLVKADVAVADLNESEISDFGLAFLRAE
jgi:hypothetical protein